MRPYGFHRDAEAEYVAAAEYYTAISPRLGRTFYEEIERLIREVCERPKSYPFVVKPVRRHLSLRFPYGLLYEEAAGEIRILAVMPLRRDPGYWKSRT